MLRAFSMILITLLSIAIFIMAVNLGFRSNTSAISTPQEIKTASAKPTTKTIETTQPSETPEPTSPPKPTGTPEPIEIKDDTKNVKISFVGDLMVHTDQLNNAYKSDGVYDFNHSLEIIAPYFTNSDLVVGNLETVFGGAEIGYTDFPRFNAPDSYGEALKNAGFNLLTTANNHANDKGEAAIIRTIDILNSLNIKNVGTYKSQEERDTILIKEIGGISFAFLSYTYGTNGLPTPAGKDYLVNIMNRELIKKDIERAKVLEPDFIIILPHMGNEYETYPKQVFKDWIYFMLECGADIVMASHPHVIQPVEYVTLDGPEGGRTCFIAYSMGNFLTSQRTTPRDEGIIFNLYFEQKNDSKPVLKNVGFIPTWMKYINASWHYDMQVLPVYDFLTDSAAGLPVDLRQKDIERLKQVHENITNIVLNKKIPLEGIQREYIISSSASDMH